MTKALTKPKQRGSRLTAATVAELLVQLGNVPAERVRMNPVPGQATKADLLRLLERDNIPCELIQATLVEKAMGQLESSLALWLGYFLGVYLETRPIGRIFGADAPHQLKPGLIRMPDLAFVTNERVPTGPQRKKPIATWIPDLAVEILSKGNTQREIDRKLQEYFEAGVRLVWVVDPRKRTAVVHTPDNEPAVLDESQTLDGGDVLPGFKLKIKDWFAKVD